MDLCAPSQSASPLDLPLLTELNRIAPKVLTESGREKLPPAHFLESGREKLPPAHFQELKPLSSSPPWSRLYPYPSKGHMYYCLMWGRGHEVYGRVHISGGAIGSELADYRAALVADAIKRDVPILELLDLVRGFPNAKRGRKPMSQVKSSD